MKIGSLCRILSYFFSEMLPSFNVRYENEAAISGLKRHSYCIFLRSQLVPFFCDFNSRVKGGELFARVAEFERLEEQEAVYFIAQILLGVNHMHQLGIVHLDLKVDLLK